MNALREGKTAVREWGHTLLIGWTDRSIAFLAEIANANASEGGGVIVVLSDTTTETMNIQFRASLTEADMQGTAVVFRQGSPLNPYDLKRAGSFSLNSHGCRLICGDVTITPTQLLFIATLRVRSGGVGAVYCHHVEWRR